MKIKVLYIFGIVCFLVLMGWILFTHDRAQTLHAQLATNGFLSNDLSARAQSSTLTGEALILYDITHSNYPHLTVKRGQFQNDITHLTFSLQGLNGDLFDYLNQTQLRSFKKQLDLYNPTAHLLTNPFMTLAILGEYNLNLDILLQGIKNAPNQISLNIIIYKQNQQKIHLSTKLTPKYPNTSLYENLKEQKLAFQLKYICPEWKQLLDDYCLSKNKPFITEESFFEFNLIK